MANTYRVTLAGVAAPALGTLLVGTGSKAVAGRVVAMDTSVAGQATVTLARRCPRSSRSRSRPRS